MKWNEFLKFIFLICFAGLQHAHSVGNLGLSTHHQHSSNGHLSGRSYESDDENMGRKKTRPVGHGLHPKTSVYSKGDIREQVNGSISSEFLSNALLWSRLHWLSLIWDTERCQEFFNIQTKRDCARSRWPT